MKTKDFVFFEKCPKVHLHTTNIFFKTKKGEIFFESPVRFRSVVARDPVIPVEIEDENVRQLLESHRHLHLYTERSVA